MAVAAPIACGGDSRREAVGHAAGAVVTCAGPNTVEGLDVSVYQGTVDWPRVAASGRGFAIARISDGTGTIDPTFAANWRGIKDAGMVRGVYQYFRAGDDPADQAAIVVAGVGTIGPGDLPPMADVETDDGQAGDVVIANLATWVGVIQSELCVTPIVYAAPGFWDALPGTSRFASETLDVANWEVSCPDTPAPWTSWTFWQYADDGSVPGITGDVDLEVFDGPADDLLRFARVIPREPTSVPEAGGGAQPFQEDASPTSAPEVEASMEEDSSSPGDDAAPPSGCRPSGSMGCSLTAMDNTENPRGLAFLGIAGSAWRVLVRRRGRCRRG